jgi:glycosyltransferase involved in cell wall biosynthesis
LRVGSWPGSNYRHNSVIATLCAALQRRGAIVVDISTPRRVRPNQIDIFQIHWPEQVFWSGGSHLKMLARVGLTLAALARMRCSGVRILWMVHNTEPYDASGFISAIWRVYVFGLRLLTQQYVVLSPRTEDVVRQRLRLSSKAIVARIHHPSYPRGRSREIARLNLGISPERRVYVFFGAIRPYKGLDDLLDAFGELADPNARLIVAGEPLLSSTATALRARAELDPRIELRLGYIEESMLTEVIDAADRVVLPFRSSLHSGSLVRALSQGKVTITPETPFALSLRDELGERWLQLYQGRLTADHLVVGGEPEGAPDMSAYEPDLVAEELLGCYRAIIKIRERAQ